MFFKKSMSVVLCAVLNTTLAVSMGDKFGLDLDGERKLQVASEFLPFLSESSSAHLPHGPLLDDDLLCPELEIESEQNGAVRFDTWSADGGHGPLAWSYDPEVAARLVMQQLNNGGGQAGPTLEGVAGSVVEKSAESKKRAAKQQAKGEFACEHPGCDQVLTRPDSLEKHERTVHRGERPYACTHEGCVQRFGSNANLERHKRTVHRGERPYVCIHEGCGQGFGAKQALTSHERVHTGERPFECEHPGCGKRFSEQRSVKAHQVVHTGEKNFACEYPGCGGKFTEKGSLKRHKNSMHSEARIAQLALQAASESSLASSNSSSSKKRERKKDGETQTALQAKKSKSVQSKPKEFVCEDVECGAIFNSRPCLTRHRRVHTGEKPFACEHPGCGKRFSQASNFKRHAEVHVKAQVAQLALQEALAEFSLASSSSSSLARSEREESNEQAQPVRQTKKRKSVPPQLKKFVCGHAGCDRSFSRKYDFENHKREHTGETFACTYSGCGEKFTHKASLIKHINAHIKSQGFLVSNLSILVDSNNS